MYTRRRSPVDRYHSRHRSIRGSEAYVPGHICSTRARQFDQLLNMGCLFFTLYRASSKIGALRNLAGLRLRALRLTLAIGRNTRITKQCYILLN